MAQEPEKKLKDPWGRPLEIERQTILTTPEEVAAAMAETRAWEDDDLFDEGDVSDLDDELEGVEDTNVEE